MADDTRRVFTTAPDGTAEVKKASAEPQVRDLQEMSFSTHVVSLNAMALMYLGEIENAEVSVDRAAARHAVDTLCMLKTKTQGNLTDEEAKLLDSVLYDLRTKIVSE